MVKKKYGALFDLDGVLIDTEGTYSTFWGEMGRIFHPEIPDFAMKIKGTTLPDILSRYFPDKEISADVCRRLKKFEGEMAFPLFPGIMDFLGDLLRNNIPCAIVTSSGADKMARLFAANPDFKDCFAAVVTSADVKRSKPDPECYLIGAAKIDIDIEDCYVFEDSINGLASGMASGATVIGLCTTLPASQLEGKAHMLIPSLDGFGVGKMLAVKQ